MDYLQSFSLETVVIVALCAGFLGYVGGTVVSKPASSGSRYHRC